MNEAEFRVRREHLGLTHVELAALLGVNERRIRKWEFGGDPIPDSLDTDFATLERAATTAVDEITASAQRTITIPRPSKDMPETGYPSGFWRAVAGRAWARHPDLRIEYSE